MTGKTIHIKNIEKYHPGYKDRHLIWFKLYFSMLDGDDEFEMLDEIDKWRFVAFTILELKNKKPVSLEEKYLTRKGFDFKRKKLLETINNLSPFVVVCNIPVTESSVSVTQNRIDYIKLEKIKLEKIKLEKEKHGEFVLLTKDEHKKLIDKFGEDGTKDRINNLNEGIGSKGYKYSSHYYTILTWDRKNNGDIEKPKPLEERIIHDDGRVYNDI